MITLGLALALAPQTSAVFFGAPRVFTGDVGAVSLRVAYVPNKGWRRALAVRSLAPPSPDKLLALSPIGRAVPLPGVGRLEFEDEDEYSPLLHYKLKGAKEVLYSTAPVFQVPLKSSSLNDAAGLAACRKAIQKARGRLRSKSLEAHFTGDLNGDGRSDAIYVAADPRGVPAPRGYCSAVVVRLGKSFHTLSAIRDTSLSGQSDEWIIDRVVGCVDVNRDGLAEIIVASQILEGGALTVYEVKKQGVREAVGEVY